MKRGQVFGMIAGICLLFCGCGAENENTDASLQDRQVEDTVEESESGTDSGQGVEESESETDGGQGVEESESEKEGERSEKEFDGEKDGGQTVEESGNEKDAEREALILQRKEQQLEERVEKQAAVLERYGTFLEEYAAQGKGSDDENTHGFALIYLDGDDIPELILIDGYAHAYGGLVYTFEEGNVVPVGEYGQYGTMHYQEKKGIVFDDYDTFGNLYFEVYRIEGRKETLLQSYSEYCMLPAEEENLQYTYTVDGKEVSEKQYREVFEKWYAVEYSEIDYHMCRTLTDDTIHEDLREELENLILRQEEAVKQEALLAAGVQESDILLWDYDDYDGDGVYEAFMMVGSKLYFAGADGCMLAWECPNSYRMIDGKMEFDPGRKYLFFYTNYSVTANYSEIWTVRDGKPVEESDLLQRGQVVYRGENERNEFEIWVDAYNHYCEKDYFGKGDDMWTGHTWRPYFYYYDSDSDQIKAYGKKIISEREFEELSGTNILEEIKAEGYTTGEIIRWDNDVVTINYNYVKLRGEDDFLKREVYENVIWDNNVKDFWQKEAMHAASWKSAGVGGSY